MKIEKGKGSQ